MRMCDFASDAGASLLSLFFLIGFHRSSAALYIIGSCHHLSGIREIGTKKREIPESGNARYIQTANKDRYSKYRVPGSVL